MLRTRTSPNIPLEMVGAQIPNRPFGAEDVPASPKLAKQILKNVRVSTLQGTPKLRNSLDPTGSRLEQLQGLHLAYAGVRSRQERAKCILYKTDLKTYRYTKIYVYVLLYILHYILYMCEL